MVQGKITEASHSNSSGRRPIRTFGAPSPQLHHSLIYTPNALPAATFPIYPVLGQAPNNAGLHIWSLGFRYLNNYSYM